MPTTTDFQEWLDNLDETHIEEIYNLYESIIGVTQMGGFTCTQNNSGQIFTTLAPIWGGASTIPVRPEIGLISF